MTFKLNWKDLNEVIDACREMPGCIVVKHEDRDNYNITHLARRDRWDLPGVEVLWPPEAVKECEA